MSRLVWASPGMDPEAASIAVTYPPQPNSTETMKFSKILLSTVLASAFATFAGAQCGNSQVVGTSCGAGFNLSCFSGDFSSGSSYSMQAALGTPGNDAFFLIGTPLATPVDLSPVGATNCTLYVEAFVTIAVPLIADGLAGLTLSIPSDTTLMDAPFMFQAATASSQNPFGLVFSNGILGTVNPTV